MREKRRKCWGCGKHRQIYDYFLYDGLNPMCKECSIAINLETRAKFLRLADKLHKETVHLYWGAFQHPAYREIIEMGIEVVPHILKELQKYPAHELIAALHEITGEKPFPENDMGKIEAMTKAWIEWGRERNLL